MVKQKDKLIKIVKKLVESLDIDNSNFDIGIDTALSMYEYDFIGK